MSESDPPSFHLRLPPDIKAKLQMSRGKNSLNKEIVERLALSLDPDPAQRLAEVLRPLITTLDESDQAKLVKLVADAVELLSSGSRKGRLRKK